MQDRSFKRSNGFTRSNPEFGNRENGFRRMNNRNNGNVDKLILKYNELAREALSNGDKILSENYLQHADHFTRILNERETYKKEKSMQETSEYDLEQTKRSLESNITEKKLDDDISKEINTEIPTKVV